MTRISKLNRTSFDFFPVVFAIVLTGCSYHVAISYLKPRKAAIQPLTLANVYMQVDRPSVSIGEGSSIFGYLKEADLPIDLDVDHFGEKVAIFLRDRGGRLSSYRVRGAADDPFVGDLKPSSVLSVQFESPSLRETEETEEKIEKDGDKEIKREMRYWTVKGQMHVRARLMTYPENLQLEASEKTLESSQRYETAGGNGLRARYAERATRLIDDAADWTVKTAIPIDIVVRHRRLYVVDSDSTSVAAAKAGELGRWSQAAPIWLKRLASESNSWKDAWNLGVSAEKQSDFKSARAYYDQARLTCAGDKDGPKPEVWNEVFLDIEQPLSKTNFVPDSSGDWFGQRIAVLPFTDVSTSLDGPLNVRRLTREILARTGYSVQSLEEVDRVLKEHGFTQGGQLAATTPDQLAQWLKVDLLLFGHLEKFDEFTLGLLGWKRVQGTYKIWSAARKDYFWISEKSVSRVATANAKSGAEIGWALLQQLAGSWADKASHKPMSEESAYYVNQQLSELPRRPR